MTERLRLTEEADRDLIDIYLYSLKEFGVQQADRYSDTLMQKLETVAENPSFGSDYSYIRAGLRRYTSVSHAIYYQSLDSGILVLRILHGSMDPARHL
ncbi:type II toxin-antitoxin system RelE/ParE family toxin [Alterisphingorhabdus coralli]|uniref:Toxin n=1 Tax=Alterisphingorhabdus coralli TaxID=3071408 RepID=A0AA97F3Q7_9SPHN|nr:type II toxin-antitoxin system RelE/ParE family toxin [Parasphingorhabdus sp. SCSIO 66989]WOE73754.1 type II toxin-antitoxin system RelE/ParE family toxin [Parasphingorhabdus sp. SCSIO 66989]